MTRRLARRFYYYCGIALVFVLLSALLQTPIVIVPAVPFLIALLYALTERDPPVVTVSVDVSATRAFEREVITVRYEVVATSTVSFLELAESLPSDAQITDGTNDIITSLAAGSRKTFLFTFVVNSTQRFFVGSPVIRIHSSSGLICWEEVTHQQRRCTVYPEPTFLRRSINPVNTQVYTGNYPSKSSGEGIEFSGVRPYVRGDRLHSISWKTSARSSRLFVKEFVLERNSDVVLLMDAFTNIGSRPGRFVDFAARGAATIAYQYLREKNRVGLIQLGYYLTYVLPSPGGRQWYRILESLAGMRVDPRHVAFEANRIPIRILPPRSMVIAFTPLVDKRFVNSLFDLMYRGFDVVPVCISPVQILREAFTQVARKRRQSLLALRIWELELARQIRAYREAGLPVIVWDVLEPFDLVARTINSYRDARRRRS